MNKSTFDILKDYYELESLLADSEGIEEIAINAEEQLAKIDESRDIKLNSIEDLKRENESKIKAIKEKVDNLTRRKKEYERNIENMKYLQNILLDGQKIKTDEYTFFYRSSQSVNVLDESVIPAEYVEQRPHVNKKLISEDIKQGVVIPGVELKEKLSINVR